MHIYIYRCTQAELALAQLKDMEDGDGDDDDDNNTSLDTSHFSTYTPGHNSDPYGGGGGGSSLTNRFGMNQRTTNTNTTPYTTPSKYTNGKRNKGGPMGEGKIIKDLEQYVGVRTNPTLAKTINIIDNFTLYTNKIIKNNSIIRIIFVLYLLFLHIWVLFVLTIHIHSIDIGSMKGPPVTNILTKGRFPITGSITTNTITTGSITSTVP